MEVVELDALAVLGGRDEGGRAVEVVHDLHLRGRRLHPERFADKGGVVHGVVELARRRVVEEHDMGLLGQGDSAVALCLIPVGVIEHALIIIGACFKGLLIAEQGVGDLCKLIAPCACDPVLRLIAACGADKADGRRQGGLFDRTAVLRNREAAAADAVVNSAVDRVDENRQAARACGDRQTDVVAIAVAGRPIPAIVERDLVAAVRDRHVIGKRLEEEGASEQTAAQISQLAVCVRRSPSSDIIAIAFSVYKLNAVKITD